VSGFRRRAGVARFSQLRADLGEFGFTLADLLAQFVFQPRVRHGSAPTTFEPAEEKSQQASNDEADSYVSSVRHGSSQFGEKFFLVVGHKRSLAFGNNFVSFRTQALGKAFNAAGVFGI